MIIALFGGSFDPFHKGHLNIITQAKKQLNIDKVYVIPTGCNPWKENSIISNQDKLRLLEHSLYDLDFVEIKKFELDNDEKNFTIDTVKFFVESEPNNQFYYLIGMDQVEKFHLWKEAKQISELVQLICFDRVGYQPNENINEFNIKKIDTNPLEFSSTNIKNGEIEGLLESTLSYISNNGLYLELLIKNYMSTKRYEHTLSVAKLAREIAKSNNINESDAYVAAMFHDIAKEMPYNEMECIMLEHYNQYMHLPRQVWHQYVSGYIAKTIFLIDNQSIIDAIYNHTTASIDMSELSMCIYVADKFDPLRSFDSTDQIRLCKKDIKKGFKKCLIDTLEYSNKKGIKLAENFKEIYYKYTQGE